MELSWGAKRMLKYVLDIRVVQTVPPVQAPKSQPLDPMREDTSSRLPISGPRGNQDWKADVARLVRPLGVLRLDDVTRDDTPVAIVICD